MTSPNHTCGTDRVYEAYQHYTASCQQPSVDTDTVVINIQGDEPFIQPAQIQALMDCFPTEIATLVHPFTQQDTWQELANPNYVKVAIAREKTDLDNAVIGTFQGVLFLICAVSNMMIGSSKDSTFVI